MAEAKVSESATISTADAHRVKWDVVIVGAGPAGAVAARDIARRGLRVLLIDRANFPRRKVCGCCLNRHALSALTATGLGDLPHLLGAVPIDSMTLAYGGRIATFAMDGGVSLSREAFDLALVQAAKNEGAEFLPGTPIRLEGREGDYWRLHGDGQTLLAKVLIDASGLNGQLTDADVKVTAQSRIGAGASLDMAPIEYDPGRIYMATGRGGYVGIVSLEDGRLDVAAAFDSEYVRRCGGLGEAAVRIVRDAGLPRIARLEEADWKGTPPLTRRPNRIAGHRWFAVGDASGYVEPFTGEGMAWAIAGAIALGPIIERAVHQWDNRLVGEWNDAHLRVVGRRQWLCRLISKVLRTPMACQLVVRGLNVVPALAMPFVQTLNRSFIHSSRGR